MQTVMQTVMHHECIYCGDSSAEMILSEMFANAVMCKDHNACMLRMHDKFHADPIAWSECVHCIATIPLTRNYQDSD